MKSILLLLLLPLAVIAQPRTPSTPLRFPILETALNANQRAGTNFSLLSTTALRVGGETVTNLPALGLLVANTVWVSAFSGSDATGERGRSDRPFLTCSNAQLVSQAGDTIYVMSGQYVEEGLGVADVGWVLAPDAIIGSTNEVNGVPGPVFFADGFDISIRGGYIQAQTTALASGEGFRFRLSDTFVFPDPEESATVSGYYMLP